MSVWVEAVEPFKLHPISMLYIYKVVEHFIQLWMGIWQHIHTVTTTDVSPDLGELAEIVDDVSVKTIPLRYCWGCRTFQTASHIHEIHLITHIQRGWAHWYAVHWHTAASLLHSFTHTTWIRFWGFGSPVMMWVCHGWGWQASPIHFRHIQSVWAYWYHWYAVHWHTAAALLHSYTHPSWLRFWGSGSLVESKWCLKVVVWSFRPSCQWHRRVASGSALLPMQSCQCAWPFNWREGPPLLHTHRQVASASALLPMQSCQCAWPLNCSAHA